MGMSEYEQFIKSKLRADVAAGFDCDVPVGPLFDFQAACVKWALKRGRAALFEDTGLGKTFQQATWANEVHKHTGGNVIIAAPLCVAHQTVEEAAKIGITIKYCRSDEQVEPGITITNYEMLEHFDLDSFVGVVLDECFPADTEIDVFNIDGAPSRKYIKDIRVGDRIANASGVDIVSDVHRREVPYAVKTIINGVAITSSPNHPYFTQRGWVGAIDLRAGDYVMETAEAMRLVRDGVHANINYNRKNAEVLRSILLSEMADAPAGKSSASACAGSSAETRGCEIGMVQDACCIEGVGTHHSIEADAKRGDSEEGEPHIENHEACTFRAWGKRERIDSAAAGDVGCAVSDLGGGISFVIGETKGGVSDALQAGLGIAREENRNRGGWSIASQQEGPGRQEGRYAGCVRVDSVEILECGHPELEKYRDADGKLYFYDLGGTRHPSFSINGLLVHNSSILKNHTSKTREQLVQSFRDTPYKLSCTATPSPNDYIELGNQADFLGVMNAQEMLATFFTHDGGDTSKWRLKGHGKTRFWEWMSTWAICIRNPSDLGFDGSAYVLPPLNVVEHVVESGQLLEGQLFAVVAQTLSERREAKRKSLEDRIKLAAQIVNESSEQFVVWAHLNDESTALVSAIHGAVEVTGSMPNDEKRKNIMAFLSGDARVLVSKPSICGFGINMQMCHNTVFAGMNDSFEEFYQAVRRFQRFGQKKVVNVHIIIAESEGAVRANIERKQRQSDSMADEMVNHMRRLTQKQIVGASSNTETYNPTVPMIVPAWINNNIEA